VKVEVEVVCVGVGDGGRMLFFASQYCFAEGVKGVRGVYELLIVVEELAGRFLIDNIWHKQVPLKVFLFVWRLHHNRLPTKDNLIRFFDIEFNYFCLKIKEFN
jgi:hypothetical protein